MKFRDYLLLTSLSLGLVAHPASSAAFLAEILPREEGPRITGLSLRNPHPEVEWERGGAEPRVKLEYAWSRPESLAFTTPAVTGSGTRSESGDSITLEIPLAAAKTTLNIQAIARDGSLEEQAFEIDVPLWEELQGQISRSNREWHARAGIGPSFFAYGQPGSSDSSGADLTITGSLTRTFLDSDWQFRAGTHLDTLTTGSAEGGDIRFFGVDAVATYPLLESEATWKLSLAGGAYYTTMLTGIAAGYHNLVGPRLYPVFSYAISPRATAEAYVRYSPVFYRDVWFVSGRREWSAGLGVSLLSRRSWTWELNLDVADLALEVVGDRAVESRRLTLTLGLTW